MAADTLQPATIVIVDDDPSTLLIGTKPLKAAGYRVLQAPGSSEALKLIAEHGAPVQLILTDVFLPPPGFQLSVEKNPYPRVNGQEMVERLLTTHRDLRVIVMSSTAQQDLCDHGVLRKDLPFLKKPFSVERLLELVRQVLAGPPAVSDPKRAASTGGEVPWFD